MFHAPSAILRTFVNIHAILSIPFRLLCPDALGAPAAGIPRWTRSASVARREIGAFDARIARLHQVALKHNTFYGEIEVFRGVVPRPSRGRWSRCR